MRRLRLAQYAAGIADKTTLDGSANGGRIIEELLKIVNHAIQKRDVLHGIAIHGEDFSEGGHQSTPIAVISRSVQQFGKKSHHRSERTAVLRAHFCKRLSEAILEIPWDHGIKLALDQFQCRRCNDWADIVSPCVGHKRLKGHEKNVNRNLGSGLDLPRILKQDVVELVDYGPVHISPRTKCTANDISASGLQRKNICRKRLLQELEMVVQML